MTSPARRQVEDLALFLPSDELEATILHLMGMLQASHDRGHTTAFITTLPHEAPGTPDRVVLVCSDVS